MASLPADEDYARSVLAIFGMKNLGPRESLALSEASAAFLVQNMGSPADFEAALATRSARGLADALTRPDPPDHARRRGNADGLMAPSRRRSVVATPVDPAALTDPGGGEVAAAQPRHRPDAQRL